MVDVGARKLRCWGFLGLVVADGVGGGPAKDPLSAVVEVDSLLDSESVETGGGSSFAKLIKLYFILSYRWIYSWSHSLPSRR